MKRYAYYRIGLGEAHAAPVDGYRFHEGVDARAGLPEEFREVLILREMEDLSYREIAGITGTPIGTVMSRLARARAILRETAKDCL